MSWPLPEDQKPNIPLRDLITAEVMKTVAGILNHITIEEMQGLEAPEIVKTARPSAETPWRIRVPAPGAVTLGSGTPAPDGTGAAGTSTSAAHADHVHPLNVDDNVAPADPADAADPGESVKYSRADHVHKKSLGTANLSSTTPAADSGTGVVGTETDAAHGDHAHALNLDATVPAILAMLSAAGSSAKYSRADHAHGDKLPDVPTENSTYVKTLNGAVEGDLAANTDTWSAASDGKALKVTFITRVRYNEGDATPSIKAYYRRFFFDKHGRLISMSSEGSFVVATPAYVSVS